MVGSAELWEFESSLKTCLRRLGGEGSSSAEDAICCQPRTVFCFCFPSEAPAFLEPTIVACDPIRDDAAQYGGGEQFGSSSMAPEHAVTKN